MNVADVETISGNRTHLLAAFVSGFHRSDWVVPDAVLSRVLELVLDGSGALLAAANPAYSTGKIISKFVREQGGVEACSVIGQDFRTSIINAALANGTMGYACDIEPHHPEAILHPIAVILPTALAVAEANNASGSEFLEAIAIGCEIEYRCSIALGPAELYALGFHPSAVCGSFGAAAAAAHLLKLNQGAVVRAFGLAACQASGLMAWESDPTENARPFQMGMAARNGVSAALLAQRGFGGPMAVFDEGHTVFRAFSRKSAPEKLTADLGNHWYGIHELAVKPYSCVAFMHPALDAILKLMRDANLTARDIKAVRMRFGRGGVHCIDGNPLKSHCAQYILAVAIVNRELKIADIFFDRRDDSPAITDLSKRITVIADDELDKIFPDFYATILEVDTAAGGTLTVRNDIARGYPESPLSNEEIEAKFRALASEILSGPRIGDLFAAIRNLPRESTVHNYARLMRERA